MRTQLAVPVLLVALLAGCAASAAGSPSSGQSTPAGQSTAAPPSATQQSAATSPTGNGKVDCAALNTAGQQLLMLQFLAQLNTTDVIASIKSKQIGNLDLDVFLAAMHELHALDGYTSPLGDPKAAIDFYEKAGKAAQVLFATEPVTQAAIDTYNQNVGTVTEFLGHQVAIAGALDAAGC